MAMREIKPLQRRITKFDLDDLEYILGKLENLVGKRSLDRNPAFKMIRNWGLRHGYWRERRKKGM